MNLCRLSLYDSFCVVSEYIRTKLPLYGGPRMSLPLQ